MFFTKPEVIFKSFNVGINISRNIKISQKLENVVEKIKFLENRRIRFEHFKNPLSHSDQLLSNEALFRKISFQ